MPVGARLVERALAEQLRVSRSPVRQALHPLGTMEWWPPPNGAAAPSLSPVRP
ncbi:GntR family transcriptional regulator [Streptomyces sp. SudanB5_2050]|uniref:GntR family transcriptional regulator n=1 Tax=Streptomyces sp. SudanB5_2050 TaxID=3035274 RepID=UPI0036DE2F86